MILKENIKNNVNSKKDNHRSNGNEEQTNKLYNCLGKKTTGCPHWPHDEKGMFRTLYRYGKAVRKTSQINVSRLTIIK